MISKELVDLLILKRSIRLDNILIDLGLFYRDEQGDIIPNLQIKDLLKKLDSLIYTLDFLLNEKKYITESRSENISGLSFHGYTPKSLAESPYNIIYIEKFLSDRLGKSYEVKPSLFQYKNRNYRTQTQKQIDDNFKTALYAASAALIASILTAFLTPLFSKWINEGSNHDCILIERQGGSYPYLREEKHPSTFFREERKIST